MYEELIASTRFTSEDLFALMGGFDMEWLVCPRTMTGPDDPKLLRKYDKWRRNAVRRHSKSGLVDDACIPCEELRSALEPLWGTGIVVANATRPIDAAERETRTAAVYLLPDGRSTIARRAGGFFGGWFVHPLHGERETIDAILLLHSLVGQVSKRGTRRRVLVPPDSGCPWINAAAEGREDDVIAEAGKWRFDPEPLLTFSRWWIDEGRPAWEMEQSLSNVRSTVAMDGPISTALFDSLPGEPVPAMVEYSACFSVGCEAYEKDGIKTGVTDGWSTFRGTAVWPSVGFAFSTQLAPKPGDPELWWSTYGKEREFTSFDVLESGEQLVRTLLVMDEFPADGRAVTYEGDDIPLWRMGGGSCTRSS